MNKRIAIKEICDVYDGPHATPKKTANGPVYLGIDAITSNGKLNSNSFSYLSEKDFIKWTKRVTPQKDDIVFSYEATLGRYAIIPQDFYGCLGRRLAIVRNKSKNINVKWLYYYFQSPEWKAFIESKIVKGSTVNRISVEDFPSYTVPLIDIKNQDKIVSILSTIDDKIENNNLINDNLRASASIMFFNKIRYVQCSECCQETEIGRYPIEWTLSTLGDVLDTIIDRRGLTPTKLGSEWSNEGIIALSAKSVKNHELVNLDIANHVDNDLYNRWMPQKLQSQDILMTSEAPLGEFYYLADFSTYCLSQRLFAMRANKTIIEPTVLYFQLTDSIGKHQIDIRKTGTTVTGIRQSELIQVPIIVPPMNIQKEFARFCNPIMITIEKNADEIRQLFKLQEMLLSRLSR